MLKPVLIAVAALGLAVSACTPTAPQANHESSAPAFESPYFTVTQHGTGPDVILVPGLASSAAVWDGTIAELQNRYRLHAIQVSGFAGAEPRGNANNQDILDDLASDLNRYAASLDSRPAIVGHSLGGLVTLKAALDAENVLERVIIVDVLPFFSVLMDPQATSESIAPVATMMKATLLAQPDDVFALRQAEALAALVKSEQDRQITLSWSVASNRDVMAQAMSEVLVTDLRADIARIQTPTTVIYAKDDAIPNMSAIEAFYEDLYAPLKNGDLVAIENGLHFIMLDQPEAFYAILSDQLASD